MLETMLATAMVGALILYALLGGADFGGGVWDLLASGPRQKAQRALIARAIGPVWEVNHVWLIIGVVLLFAAFPRAFAVVSTALHVPLTLFLLGVVFRGAAFTFRAYDLRGDDTQRRWGRLFSIASVVSPALLGMCVGALASGAIIVEGDVVRSGFFAPWTSPFAVATGALTLGLFTFLAAVYLAAEADSPALASDFRLRALASAIALFLAAACVLALSRTGAPKVWATLTQTPLALALHALTALSALTAFALLWRRRFHAARAAAALQGALIVSGWAASQQPELVVGALTVHQAAAGEATLRALAMAGAAGALVTGPSLYLLYRIFGRGAARGGAATLGLEVGTDDDAGAKGKG
jgi:cytochrome d ubiquinol oxidase subunit II